MLVKQKKVGDSNAEFRPWLENYRDARITFSTGVIWMASGLSWCAISPGIASVSFTTLAVAPLYFGFVHLGNGQKRKRGLLVEQIAVAKLMEILPTHWKAKADIKAYFGNIDAFVEIAKNCKCIIDVKSWEVLFLRNDKLQRPGKNGVAEAKKAILDCEKQRKYLKAEHAFLWLPRAEYQHPFSYQGVKIVYGGPKTLRAEVLRIESNLVECIVRFEAKPPELVRKSLKHLGFSWVGEMRHWRTLFVSRDDLDEDVLNEVVQLGGSVSWKRNSEDETQLSVEDDKSQDIGFALLMTGSKNHIVAPHTLRSQFAICAAHVLEDQRHARP